MDVFRLFNTGSTWAEGEFIKGIDSKVWSERYRSPGEFTFKAKPTKQLIDALPIGSLISHTNTLDVMIVENHEIVEKKGENPEITISGRSVDSFMEQRVATDDALGFDGPGGSNGPKPHSPLFDGSPWPYLFKQATQRGQILSLIRSQIQDGYTERNSFVLPHTRVNHEITDTSAEEEREVKRGPLNVAVQELLADMDAGLRIERPHSGKSYINWIVHDGTNRKGTVQFSHDAGDLETAKYFKTSKSDKDSAYITASYWGIFWTQAGTYTGFNRRVMWIDVNDIKMNPAENGPFGFNTAARIEKILEKRARRQVLRKKVTDILEATVSKEARFKYRRDYQIGDLVYVLGNYDSSDVMRVVEYVETEDEEGERGFPTLIRAPGY